MIRLWRRFGRRLPPCTRNRDVELYAIHDAPDGTIVMIEKWTSVGDLDDHGLGEAVRALNASLEGLLASPTGGDAAGAVTSWN